MKLGMVGLGRMGGNMAERLRRGGHEVVGYDRDPDGARRRRRSPSSSTRSATRAPGGVGDGAGRRRRPSRRSTSSPALLGPGDVVVDGGNSNFRDSIRRAAALAEQGIGFVDAGTSGGVWGLDERLRPDGRRRRRATWPRCAPVLETLAPAEDGLRPRRPGGAGHFTKMVHNGIEYGMMQAFAEGYAILARQRARHRRAGRRSSRGRTAASCAPGCSTCSCSALERDPRLRGHRAASAADSGEGRWTVNEAVRLGVAAPVISAALFARFVSQDEDQLDDEGHRRPAPPVRRPHRSSKADPSTAPPRPTASESRRRRPIRATASSCSAPPATWPPRSCSRRSTSIARPSGSTRPGHRRVVVGVERRAAARPGPREHRRPRSTTVDDEVLDRLLRPPHLPVRRLPRGRRPSTASPSACAAAGIERPLFYLAIPPALFDDVDRRACSGSGCTRTARVVVEKPFGRDLASARELNDVPAPGLPRGRRLPHRPLPREGVGREPARVPLRQLAARAGVEPQLHLERADHDGRGLRRRAAAASSTRASARCATSCRTTCCRSSPCWPWSRRSRPTPTRWPTRRPACSARCAPIDPADVVRGQYRGYADEEGVQAGSDVETYVALRFEIDSWRWAGVPWLIRTGKSLGDHRHRGGRAVQRPAPPALRRGRRPPGRARTTCASAWAATTA